jgi:hypothetical protein
MPDGTNSDADQSLPMVRTSALDVAKYYVRFIETGDREGIANSVADDVVQIFPISFEATGDPQGIFSGKKKVVDYTYGRFRKFTGLRWPDSSVIRPPVPWPGLLAVGRHRQLEQVLRWRASRLAAANAINCCRRNVCEGMANAGSLQAQTIKQRP